jgi:hypothetical protein
VTVSIGVTESDGHEAPGDVLRRGDAELYTAKEKGRNRVAVCAPRKGTREESRGNQASQHSGS